jgi:hypothetical protein
VSPVKYTYQNQGISVGSYDVYGREDPPQPDDNRDLPCQFKRLMIFQMGSIYAEFHSL